MPRPCSTHRRGMCHESMAKSVCLCITGYALLAPKSVKHQAGSGPRQVRRIRDDSQSFYTGSYRRHVCARSAPDPDAYNPDPDADNPDTYTDPTDPHTDCDGHRYADRYRDCNDDCDGDRDVNCNCDADGDRYCDADGDRHCDTDCDGYGNADGDGYGNADRHCDEHRNSE